MQLYFPNLLVIAVQPLSVTESSSVARQNTYVRVKDALNP